MFADFVIIEAIQKIVVTATSRHLMIFDLESLQKLPAEINTSPSIHAIKRMSADQPRVAAAVLQAPKVSLANCPTMLYIGPEIDSYRFNFFVSDDQGDIQVFDILVTPCYKSPDYQLVLQARPLMHRCAISRLSTVISMERYATASRDMNVKMWNFDRDGGNRFIVLRVFRDTEPILRFHMSDTQKVLLTTGISRGTYSWSILPVKRIFKLGGH
jgi:hypothetical protein